MGADNFLVLHIAKNVKTRFNTSNYELERLFTKGKDKNVIELMIDKLGEKTMAECSALRLQKYSYLTHNGNENKKVKGTKTCSIKWKFKFEDYKHCLETQSWK